MVLLTAHDPLPARPARVLVAGTSGAGKSTVAAAVAEILSLPYFELDALFHGPNWVPRAEFARDVDTFSSQNGWVSEWQYDAVRPVLAARAGLLIWLDLDRATVLRQILRRTIVRRLHRQVLWNGNVEAPLWTVFIDSEHVVRWAWRTHGQTERRVLDVMVTRPELVVVRLTSRRAVRKWLEQLAVQTLRDQG